MSKDKTINIFYACDVNFIKYTMVSLASLMENASRDRDYTVHILYSDMSENAQNRVLSMQKDGFHIVFDDVSFHLGKLNAKLPVRDYYTKTTYFRLFIPDMYPEIKKAVYIDSDTVVLGDIAELYDTDVTGCYLAACPEQVMAQTEVFGDYSEKVLGVPRNKYFNAGVLLINCRAFRKDNILSRFCSLLSKYKFVVAQDQDYLNVLCKGKVKYLDQGWNCEMFGKQICTDGERKIIHYIFVSKPWHYKGCRCEDMFWYYAKRTSAYDEILREREHYTDEQKAKDAAGSESLIKKAEDELAREDNYYNKFVRKELAPDRLAVEEKIARYEREGRFDEDVEDDPPAPPLLPDDINYLPQGLLPKFKTKAAFLAARMYVKNILKKKRMIIKELRGVEHFQSLKTGAVITCNHFNAFDSFAIQIAYEAAKTHRHRLYRVIREGNYTGFPGFYGFLMRNCYTLPLSSNIKTMHKFNSAVAEVLSRGDFVLIYPEQSMWWNYRKPKPLKTGGFSIAAKNGVPVIPCFITMKDSDYVGADGYNIKEYTIHVSEPIYPDPEKRLGDNVKRMADKNFEVWREIYEREYDVPLSYTTETENDDDDE